MKGLGFDNDLCSRQEVRQIQAIANYKRICVHLTNVSRTYRQCFNDAELCFVEAPPKEIWPAKSSQRFFVHAEIQMLVHYQRLPVEKRPQYIGTSKRPCFLCFHFIRAHNQYATRDSHGEVYNQWTVPANHNYLSPSQRAGLTSALKQTSNAVRQALQRSKAKRMTGSQTNKQPQQQQSFIDLAVDALRTPSVSTLRSIIASISGGEAVNRIEDVQQQRQQQQFRQIESSAKNSGLRTASVERSCPLPNIIRAGRTEDLPCEDMICLMTFGDSRDAEQDDQYGSWRRLGADELRQDDVQTIHIGQLLAGKVITLARKDSSPSLSLILVSPQGQRFGLELAWHYQ
ncbi:hypothetical protein KC316_g13800 [Hortaea werneckii]|nr:hypothetical protein KC324_g14992 [Hortaea werneckii]KAI7555444.1 hypothetical protein KC316_g13800 [Hortaea werneckii]